MMRLRYLGIVLVALLGCALAVAQTTPAPTQSGFFYNGITHTSFQPDEYDNFGQPTGQGTDSRTELAATHASWTGVLATWYQSNATATTIAADSTRTPTDTAVIFAINELHAKGIKVMLKPHVDSEDGAWRGTFQPSNLDAWFQSFTSFILHYAQIAQNENVELLCFGTEYVQLSGAQNQARWDAVIAAIRQVYAGKLVYAANATFTGDEFTSVSFWDKVDLLGIDGYFPLTNHADPTLPELIAAWRNNEFGEDLVATVQNFADAHQKPLIFTELGYESVAGTNTAPFSFTLSGTFDPTEQDNCYTAFYTVWAPENSWMLGIFWWDWPVQPPSTNDLTYNPRGKPVESVLKTFQGPPSGSPAFNLAANPESISMLAGSSVTSTIAINPSGGFTSPVTLSVAGLPAGITATLNSSVVTGASTTVTFSAAGTVPVGTVGTVTVTGTGGGITSSIAIRLSVIAPDFSLAASPSQLNVNQNGSVTGTINIAQMGGFSGSVTLSASNLPSGVTATFSPASATGTFSVVTFTASSSATLISSQVMITGTSGSLRHTTSINLTVQPPLNDFSLSAGSPTITQGGTGSTTVTITPMGIFNGSVALSANGVPGGVTATFSPASATTSSTLTFAATSTASLGIATISITGTSGNISHTIQIHLTVNQVTNPDFSLAATNATVTQGGTGNSTVTVTPLGGFSGSVALAASGLPAGVTASFSPASTTGTSTLTFTASSTAATGTTNVTVTGTSGTLSHTASVSLTVNVHVNPGFSLSASPANVSVTQGASAGSMITVTPVGGFTGSVALTASGLPAGVTASFSPASTTGSSTVTFSASTTATLAAATVMITGTSGTLTATAPITLTVNAPATPNFSLSTSATNLVLHQGATATDTITVTPSGGFNGSVALSVSGLPAGVTASFNPASTGGTSTLTFTASSTATTGTSSVTVTGTSGTLTHTTSLTLTVSPAVIGTGGVTVTTVINSNSAFFDDEGVKLTNTGVITALAITITVQNTGGLGFNGQYNTVGGSIADSHSSTATAITYQYNLSAGQTLSPGSGYLFDAQMSATGTAHPTTGDTFSVTYTTGGQTFTQTGHF
jgi:uncharacterized membrane protein